jgi:hypothetical protein
LTRSDAYSAISLNIARIRHAAVPSIADKVIGAVKSGALNHMFLVGGCEWMRFTLCDCGRSFVLGRFQKTDVSKH